MLHALDPHRELRRKPDLFESFVEQFQHFPCVLLKGYQELIDEEVQNYPGPSGIDICALAFNPLGDEGNRLSNLPSLLEGPELVEMEKNWNEAGPEIVAGMVSLVPNYPPDGRSYTADEIDLFINIASLGQLVEHGHGEFDRFESGRRLGSA